MHLFDRQAMTMPPDSRRSTAESQAAETSAGNGAVSPVEEKYGDSLEWTVS